MAHHAAGYASAERTQYRADRSAEAKGFGCRPVVTYPRRLRAGVRKPAKEEPAGGVWAVAVYGDLMG
jgi:hypothetical protein